MVHVLLLILVIVDLDTLVPNASLPFALEETALIPKFVHLMELVSHLIIALAKPIMLEIIAKFQFATV
jgi:hypothetical protein